MVGKACAGLLAGGVALLVLGALAFYGRAVVLDEQAFADRAASVLTQDEVQDEIGLRLAGRAIEDEPDLAQLRPTVEAAVADAVQDPQFPAHFRAGTQAMHHALFSGGSVDLVLPGAAADIRAAVPERSRALALLSREDPSLFHLGGGGVESGLVELAPDARRAASLAPVAIVLGLALLILAALRAPDRRRGARRAALALAVTGGVLVAATTIGRAVVLSTFDTSHGDVVVGTIWDTFLGDLRLWGLVLGAGGLVAAAVLEPGARGAWRRPVTRALAPCGTPGRLARAAALVLLAAALLWMPEVPLDLALVAAAGVLVFTAAAEVVRLSFTR
ncbi:hypothetical protein OJ997_24925 [Solirubrobacter phytolaccae]|uniref:Uncharacterized protein n=1 Tax=Solirubrobacter phytolaccae TaxID=1404360 RepID=A0A9X3NEN2_9ACTN|nr:hypothetical protein [Solirubrobacter phytolaccae]MDA0183577.1 hypothetical protein [Solirubrobacter phytolaccae]